MKRLITSILLSLFAVNSANATENTKLNIVLDTSGSMSPYTEYIAESILKIKQHSSAHPSLTENIGLFSFTNKTEFVKEGDSDDIYTSIKKIETAGGVEDGLIAIDKILSDPSVKDTHIILFTDEGRDVVKNIDVNNLILIATEKNITIHSVLKTSNLCHSKKFIGVNNKRAGYTISSKWLKCNENKGTGSLNAFIKPKNNDYINLALSTGGVVWSINNLFANNNLTISSNKSGQIKMTGNHNPNAINSFSHFIANELYNSYERKLFAKVLTIGELTTGNIITLDANNIHTKEGSESIFDAWEWDINSDGYIDDYGPVITLDLQEQGTKQITLWLTGQIKGNIIREKQEITLIVR